MKSYVPFKIFYKKCPNLMATDYFLSKPLIIVFIWPFILIISLNTLLEKHFSFSLFFCNNITMDEFIIEDCIWNK